MVLGVATNRLDCNLQICYELSQTTGGIKTYKADILNTRWPQVHAFVILHTIAAIFQLVEH